MLTSLPGWRMVVAALLLGLCADAATAQIYELPRPDTSDTKTFGVSVAIDGNVAVVGASGEATCGDNAGAAYVYERPDAEGLWERVARLTPSDCRANAFFGERVDVDGDRIIVSASSEFFAYEKSNAAYIFERDTTVGPVAQRPVSGAQGRSADSVATADSLAEEQDRPPLWRETARLTRTVGEDRSEGVFAAGVSLDGDRAVVSTSGDVDGQYGGAVYVFEYRADRDFWERTARLTTGQGVAHGILGGKVDLDGDRIAVAASTYFDREPGSVYLFQRDSASNTWRETARIGDVRDFFISLDLNGSTLIVGESRAGRDESGRATIHRELAPGSWEKVATLRPSTPYEGGAFGSTVSFDDGWALVTGYDEQLGQDFNIDRVVYAFRENEGTWTQRTIIDIGEVAFGADIAQDGRTALISSVPEDKDGAAYVVRLH